MYFTFLYLIKCFFLQQLSQSHHTCFLNYEKIKINALNKKKKIEKKQNYYPRYSSYCLKFPWTPTLKVSRKGELIIM